MKKDLFMRIVIFSLALGRCVSAKSIDGLSLKNEVKQEDLANEHYGEKNGRDLMDEKINEALIQAFDCEKENMANTEVSLNPPAKCN